MEFTDYSDFLDRFFDVLNSKRLDVSELRLDHIAYKASSKEEYEILKSKLLEISDLKKENIVRERKVGMFKLKKSWKYLNRVIDAVELIAPKDGEVIKTGYEHAEFLLNESFESFMKKYPDLDWDTSVVNESDFPMLKLRLTEDIQVKFPRKSILDSTD